MTTATLTTVPRTASPSAGRRYGRMWSRVPRELGYLALTALIGLIVSSVAWSGIGAGSGVFVVLGVLLLIALMLASRSIGAFDLLRLRWARTRAIAEPTWSRPFAGKRPLRAIGDIVADGHYWLYALHTAVLSPLLALMTCSIWSAWLGTALAALIAPFLGFPQLLQHAGWIAHPRASGYVGSSRSLPDFFGWVASLRAAPVDPAQVGWATAGLIAVGLLLVALLPFVTRGLTLAHWGLARLLLGRFASEDLRGEVARADAARAAAVSAEDTALRRLERDIHDGPQQRLLRLQMELGTAERRITAGDAEAGESIAAARLLATETLDELRALAQGFAPPLLQDRGLSTALGALGRRGAVPVETAIAISGELPEAIERSVYFIAAELTTNAIKHADASRVVLEASTPGEPRRLRLVVTDDGRGGAAVRPDHGLSGIERRVEGLGGTLTLTSPAGGPTVATVEVPLP